jgi:hypothetical protein
MTKKEAIKLMNTDVQRDWFILSLAASLASCFILGVILWITGINGTFLFWAGVLGTSYLTYFLFGKIEISNIKVPSGSKALIIYEGEIIPVDNTVENINIPIVSSINIPVIGLQPKYSGEVVNMRDQFISETIEGITTWKDNIRIKVIMDIYFVVINIDEYVKNRMSNNNSDADSSSEGKMKTVIKTAAKRVADSFTYEQIDDSEVCTKTGSPYIGMSFSEAIIHAITHDHGVTCAICTDNSIDIAEWGLKIIKILPKETLAVNDEVLESRERKTIEEAERKSELFQMGTLAKMASCLVKGEDEAGTSLFAAGVKNPYKNMPRKELNALIERHLKMRPNEIIITSSSTGSSGGMSPVIEGLFAQMLSKKKP